MSFNPFKDFEKNLATVVDAGGRLPDGYEALKARLADYTRIATPVRDRLVAAILDGTGDDIAALRATAGGERAARDLDQDVDNAVRARLRELAATVAAENYELLAKSFTATAEKMVAAFAKVDPDLSADEVVRLSPADVKTWNLGRDLSDQLTAQVDGLVAAAVLANIPDPREGRTAASLSDFEMDKVEIGLVLATAGQHRRQAWRAWLGGLDPVHDSYTKSDVRRRQWSAVFKAGIPIQAVELDQYQAYKLPPQAVSRVVDGKTIHVDPCDYPDETIPVPEVAKVALPNGMTPRRPRGFDAEVWDALSDAERAAITQPSRVQYPEGSAPALNALQLQQAAQRWR